MSGIPVSPDAAAACDLQRRALLGALVSAVAAPPLLASGFLPRELSITHAAEIESSVTAPFSAVELNTRLAEAVFRRAGITPRREVFPWPRAQDRVKRGESDAFVTVPTPSRRAYALFCHQPVLSDVPCVWFSRRSPRADRLRRVTALEELASFRAVMYRGSGWTQSVLTGVQPMVATTTDAMMRIVAAGRGDFFLDGRIVTLPRLYALGLLDEFEARPLRVDLPYAFHIGVSRARQDADAVVAAFDSATLQLEEVGALEDMRQAFIQRFEQLAPR